MIDAKTCINDAQEKMDMAGMYLEEALAHIRAGKASTRLLDGIRVDSYGSMVPISNVAAVTTPDARSIAIQPWDKSMFRIIEKAIMDSDLGITPENNGEIIRLGIPPLTEERRKQLAKQCKGEGETAKVSIRNASAWAMVLGNPSKITPLLSLKLSNELARISIINSSGSNWP